MCIAWVYRYIAFDFYWIWSFHWLHRCETMTACQFPLRCMVILQVKWFPGTIWYYRYFVHSCFIAQFIGYLLYLVVCNIRKYSSEHLSLVLDLDYPQAILSRAWYAAWSLNVVQQWTLNQNPFTRFCLFPVTSISPLSLGLFRRYYMVGNHMVRHFLLLGYPSLAYKEKWSMSLQFSVQ